MSDCGIKSYSVGKLSSLGTLGGVDVPSMTFFYFLKMFYVACPLVAFNYAKKWKHDKIYTKSVKRQVKKWSSFWHK